MPNGKKKKGHKMATHKRKKRLRKNRHKSRKKKRMEGVQSAKGSKPKRSFLFKSKKVKS